MHETWRALYASGLTCLLSPGGKVRAAAFPNHSSEKQAESDEYPEPWKAISRRVHGHVPSLWTYWELGLDLAANFSAERRRLFKEIVRSLSWPAGRIVFWPLSQETEGQLITRADCFWQGVCSMEPKYIVCFGFEAFQALFPGQTSRYGFFPFQGRFFLYLPGPRDMLPDNRAAKHIAWQLLQKLQLS